MTEDDEYSQDGGIITAITAVVSSAFIGAMIYLAIDAWFS